MFGIQNTSSVDVSIVEYFFFLLKMKHSLWGSATQNRLIFQLCFIMPEIKLYVCRILCENFIQIGQKIKKL